MELAQKLDSYGKPAWIALTVLGFMAWWPWVWRSWPSR